jgi:plastocyanin
MALKTRSIHIPLAVVLALTMLAGISTAPAKAAVVVRAVTVAPFVGAFRPATTSVTAGTRVVFRAVSGRHTVTSYSANWSINRTIDANPATVTPASVAFRFRRTGAFRFRCLFHSTLVAGTCDGMCGRVIVR